MVLLILILGLLLGCLCNILISDYDFPKSKHMKFKLFEFIISRLEYSRKSDVYRIVQLLTVILVTISYIKFGTSVMFIKMIILINIIIIITFIDLKHSIIPDKYPLIIFIVGLIFMLFTDFISVNSSIYGFLAGFIILFLFSLIPGGMGGGDIKMMAAIGIYIGLKATLLSLYLAFVIGGIISFILVLSNIKNRKDQIPFGPYLSIGVLISQLLGEELLQLYVSIIR